MVIDYDSDALSVDVPDVLVGIDVVIGSQNREQGVDIQHRQIALVVHVGLHDLLSDLIIFKKRLFLTNEIKGLLVLALLRQYFQVQSDELLVDFKFWLLHELEEEKVGDVEDLSLERQREADQVHRFNGPLCIDVLMMHFVEM